MQAKLPRIIMFMSALCCAGLRKSVVLPFLKNTIAANTRANSLSTMSEFVTHSFVCPYLYDAAGWPNMFLVCAVLDLPASIRFKPPDQSVSM